MLTFCFFCSLYRLCDNSILNAAFVIPFFTHVLIGYKYHMYAKNRSHVHWYLLFMAPGFQVSYKWLQRYASVIWLPRISTCFSDWLHPRCNIHMIYIVVPMHLLVAYECINSCAVAEWSYKSFITFKCSTSWYCKGLCASN